MKIHVSVALEGWNHVRESLKDKIHRRRSHADIAHYKYVEDSDRNRGTRKSTLPNGQNPGVLRI